MDVVGILTNTTVFTTNESARNTATFNLVAGVISDICVVSRLLFLSTLLQATVERFDLCCPKLERTGRRFCLAAEGDLWRTLWSNLIDNFPV